MTTEDLKVTELESEEIQDEYEAEAKEYVQMAQKTIIPLKQENQIEEDTFEPKFYQQDPGAAFNASGSTTTDAGYPSYDSTFGTGRDAAADVLWNWPCGCGGVFQCSRTSGNIEVATD